MSPRLSIIPAGAVTDPALEPRDLQMLCLLGRHIDNQGWCIRSQVRMAQEISCSRASVQRSLERLVDAGWVEKKQRQGAEDGIRPHSSYLYRVLLDRDDDDSDRRLRSRHSTPMPDRDDGGDDRGCPPVSTPPTATEDAQPDEHPGAQPCVGTGAHTYVGTNNDPLERPHLERERDARARATDEFIAKFRARWPTAAVDDQRRLAYAAAELTADEQAAALAGIEPFLAALKRANRKGIPAGWRYLEEKRWTLLEQEQPAVQSAFLHLDPESAEGRAVLIVYAVARTTRPFMSGNGKMNWRGEITPQLLAMATAPPRDQWVRISERKQIGAWAGFLDKYIRGPRPVLLVTDAGGPHLMAPWHWPPRKDGALSPDGGEETLMTEDDAAVLAQEGLK